MQNVYLCRNMQKSAYRTCKQQWLRPAAPPRSLIRAFAVHIQQVWTLKNIWTQKEGSSQTTGLSRDYSQIYTAPFLCASI